MHTHTQRFTSCAALVAAILFLTTSPLYAQRDAGAKVRGEYTFGSRAMPARTYSPGAATTQRSFSYEPADATTRQRSYSYVADQFHVGDKVVVSADHANMMSGSETRGVLDRGATFEVRKIQGPWLLTETERDGKKVTGWVWFGSVTHPSSADSASRPQTARRSFSYEPSSDNTSPTMSRRAPSRKRWTWEYSKTDPRRYRP